MKIVVGLGNPGVEYQITRHNVGGMVVDKLSEKLESDYEWRRKKEIMTFENKDWILVKSAGIFMNESGRMVREAIGNRQWGIEDLYIIHDDLDIKLGEYKIQFGKGPKVHGGVNSVEGVLGTDQFWRIRVGIDNRKTPVEGEQYVLQKFSAEEKAILDEVIVKIVEELIVKLI